MSQSGSTLCAGQWARGGRKSSCPETVCRSLAELWEEAWGEGREAWSDGDQRSDGLGQGSRQNGWVSWARGYLFHERQKVSGTSGRQNEVAVTCVRLPKVAEQMELSDSSCLQSTGGLRVPGTIAGVHHSHPSWQEQEATLALGGLACPGPC